MTDPNELIAQSKSICEAATPGPWDYNARHDCISTADDQPVAYISHHSVPDVEFILTARTLVPELAAALKLYQNWHEKAIELQGPEPGRTPSMVYSWIVNLKRERDEARAELHKTAALLEVANAVIESSPCPEPREGTSA